MVVVVPQQVQEELEWSTVVETKVADEQLEQAMLEVALEVQDCIWLNK